MIPGCQTTRSVVLVLKNQNKTKWKTNISSVLDNSVYSLIIFNEAPVSLYFTGKHRRIYDGIKNKLINAWNIILHYVYIIYYN